jgi:hypothetical protein
MIRVALLLILASTSGRAAADPKPAPTAIHVAVSVTDPDKKMTPAMLKQAHADVGKAITEGSKWKPVLPGEKPPAGAAMYRVWLSFPGLVIKPDGIKCDTSTGVYHGEEKYPGSGMLGVGHVDGKINVPAGKTVDEAVARCVYAVAKESVKLHLVPLIEEHLKRP